jgi:hypothetical protein
MVWDEEDADVEFGDSERTSCGLRSSGPGVKWLEQLTR